MPALLGCIADDLAGATALAALLSSQGLRTTQLIGVPGTADDVPEADALVVALATRTAPAGDAVRQSRAALAWLRGARCRQILFAYASTFDSTEDGNIGPVADALVESLGCGFAIACPAAPAEGRTVFMGHLFVNQVPLNESAMRDHPRTPMRDANLVRLLSRQTEGTVGLVAFPVVAQGAAAIRAALSAQKEQGRRFAVVDAATGAQLLAVGQAVAGQALVTGAPGIAAGLAANFREAGLLHPAEPPPFEPVPGHAAVLAGSCARTTLFQLGAARDRLPTLALNLLAAPDATALAAQALSWAEPRLGPAPVLIATATTPDQVAALRTRLGLDAADALVQDVTARIARGLVERGVRRLLVAGGETAATVVAAIGIRRLSIGPSIEPGLCWTRAEGEGPPLLLALKPGTAGARDIFLNAFVPVA